MGSWKLEAPVKKSVALPAAVGWLVLLHHHPMRGKRVRNLLYVDANGLERWRADMPKGTVPDSFVDVKVEDGEIVAWTLSGYRVVLDDTGATVSMRFTK
jgi:hypothetical protein